MKKVVVGKLYDTETARVIAKNPHYSDCDFCEETLYRKRNGEYFRILDHDGLGPCTFVPISEEEAKALCEEWLDGDAYMDLFGQVEE